MIISQPQDSTMNTPNGSLNFKWRSNFGSLTEKEFQKAQKAYLGQKLFHMEGDCFKRPRYGSRTPEEQIWLERRNISFNADSHDFSLLFSKELPQKLVKDLRLLFPIYRFLVSTAEETLRLETERELAQR